MRSFLLGLLLVLSVNASAAEMKLWYVKPAAKWEQEALPIGNGRLGCMIFGGMQKEHLQFNEDSLWIGDETDILKPASHSSISSNRAILVRSFTC